MMVNLIQWVMFQIFGRVTPNGQARGVTPVSRGAACEACALTQQSSVELWLGPHTLRQVVEPRLAEFPELPRIAVTTGNSPLGYSGEFPWGASFVEITT